MTKFDHQFFLVAQKNGVHQAFLCKDKATDMAHKLAEQLGLEHAEEKWSAIKGSIEYFMHIYEYQVFDDHGERTLYKIKLDNRKAIMNFS